jgi:hypothetical protein
MTQRLFLVSGLLGLLAGLALFALSAGINDSPTVHGQDGTATAVTDDDGTGTPGTDDDGTGTPDADDDGTRTPGPLTPVSTPTTGGAVGGESTGPGGLPSTGDGSASGGGGAAGIAIAGIALAMAGGTLAFLGARRKSI